MDVSIPEVQVLNYVKATPFFFLLFPQICVGLLSILPVAKVVQIFSRSKNPFSVFFCSFFPQFYILLLLSKYQFMQHAHQHSAFHLLLYSLHSLSTLTHSSFLPLTMTLIDNLLLSHIRRLLQKLVKTFKCGSRLETSSRR